MSSAIWPPIDDDQLLKEQEASQARELAWLLVQLRETLKSLKAGLEECAALLAPSENGSTLVLSSVRSESLKGLITRIGTRITKGVRFEYLTITRIVLINSYRTSNFELQVFLHHAGPHRTISSFHLHPKRRHWSFPSSLPYVPQSTAAWMSSM